MTYETPKNTIEFKVYGKYALFTDPVTKTGGEKCSYQIPTYEAIKGIAKSIYWKPTFLWIIDEMRVMNKIEMETKGIRPINYDGGNDLSIYTYLKNVEYHVRAHFEWNEFREDLKQDRNDGKHYEIAKRSLEKGGRQDIFLGSRECQGYVEPCVFGEGTSKYDDIDELSFGMMFHSFGYPNESSNSERTNTKELSARLWNAKMQKGVIKFPKPKDCQFSRIVKSTEYAILSKDIKSVNDEYEEMFSNKEAKI
ncbi:type I-C CRISPR-associated protein Cas5c [Endomicrobium proavitum]|uniref:pre-crRNA processing endonuclease n=1 Tax=Endomicrobium proavitum TaxID=1408281 RepID=A0A0G3WKS4_9BACT|nr:type I-C CRISPR-associated protein Cas5c [Endomicrobium proavitum]AKL98465.1 CRISPR-associated protein Cas5 [Endomicrobium proavitum]